MLIQATVYIYETLCRNQTIDSGHAERLDSQRKLICVEMFCSEVIRCEMKFKLSFKLKRGQERERRERERSTLKTINI